MYLSITNLNEIPKPLLNKTMEIHLPKDSWIEKLLVDELRNEDPHLVMVEYKKMKGVNDCNFCNKLAGMGFFTKTKHVRLSGTFHNTRFDKRTLFATISGNNWKLLCFLARPVGSHE